METPTNGGPFSPFAPAANQADPLDPAILRAQGLNGNLIDKLQYFRWQHLPPHLQVVSEPFAAVAVSMACTVRFCDQLMVGLQHLLEAKDAIVRAGLPVRSEVTGSSLPPRGSGLPAGGALELGPRSGQPLGPNPPYTRD